MFTNSEYQLPTAVPSVDTLDRYGQLYHDSRCIRIGQSLLDNHPEAAAAELDGIQVRAKKIPAFLQLQFLQRTRKDGLDQVQTLVSVIINLKNGLQETDMAKVRTAVCKMGHILDELIRDEGHIRENKDRNYKMTIGLKALGLSK